MPVLPVSRPQFLSESDLVDQIMAERHVPECAGVAWFGQIKISKDVPDPLGDTVMLRVGTGVQQQRPVHVRTAGPFVT